MALESLWPQTFYNARLEAFLYQPLAPQSSSGFRPALIVVPAHVPAENKSRFDLPLRVQPPNDAFMAITFSAKKWPHGELDTELGTTVQ